MNKRLKELAADAGYPDYMTYGQDKVLERFAELIIRECAEVAQDFVTVENNKLVEKIHISPWHLQDKIKEHFGVEE